MFLQKYFTKLDGAQSVYAFKFYTYVFSAIILTAFFLINSYISSRNPALTQAQAQAHARVALRRNFATQIAAVQGDAQLNSRISRNVNGVGDIFGI